MSESKTTDILTDRYFGSSLLAGYAPPGWRNILVIEEDAVHIKLQFLRVPTQMTNAEVCRGLREDQIMETVVQGADHE